MQKHDLGICNFQRSQHAGSLEHSGVLCQLYGFKLIIKYNISLLFSFFFVNAVNLEKMKNTLLSCVLEWVCYTSVKQIILSFFLQHTIIFFVLFCFALFLPDKHPTGTPPRPGVTMIPHGGAVYHSEDLKLFLR